MTLTTTSLSADPVEPSAPTSPPRATIGRRFGTPRTCASASVLVTVIALVACSRVDERSIGVTGLIGVLPTAWWIAAVVSVIAFAVHLSGAISTRAALIQLSSFVFLLYGAAPTIESEARTPTAYVHVGFVDYIVRNGGNLSSYDARFSWSGSLGLGALMTQLVGGDPTIFIRWAPIALELLVLPALLSIAWCLTGDLRVSMWACWFFYSLNWVGQDYWSPQGVNFVVFCCAVAAALAWIPRRPDVGPVRRLAGPRGRFEPAADSVVPRARRSGLVVLAVCVMAVAISFSHQLTPFFMLAAFTVLYVVDRRDVGIIPIFLVLVAVAWVSWGATEYWIGHLDDLTGDVGNVGGSVNSGVGDRISGSASSRQILLYTRVLVSCAVWLAAGVSYLVVRRKRHAFTTLVLVGSFMPAMGLQSYGGELPLRIFLFSLPFACVLIAWAVVPLGRSAIPAGLLALVLIPLLMYNRHGNELYERVLPEDLAAVEVLYDVAPPGSRIVSISTFSPLRNAHLEDYRLKAVRGLSGAEDPVAYLAEREITDGFVLITTGQVWNQRLTSGAPQDWAELLTERLVQQGATVRFHDRLATVIELPAAN